jgi:hypothetical protein
MNDARFHLLVGTCRTDRRVRGFLSNEEFDLAALCRDFLGWRCVESSDTMSREDQMNSSCSNGLRDDDLTSSMFNSKGPFD